MLLFVDTSRSKSMWRNNDKKHEWLKLCYQIHSRQKAIKVCVAICGVMLVNIISIFSMDFVLSNIESLCEYNVILPCRLHNNLEITLYY